MAMAQLGMSTRAQTQSKHKESQGGALRQVGANTRGWRLNHVKPEADHRPLHICTRVLQGTEKHKTKHDTYTKVHKSYFKKPSRKNIPKTCGCCNCQTIGEDYDLADPLTSTNLKGTTCTSSLPKFMAMYLARTICTFKLLPHLP